jgi:hypothetical protein
MKVLENIRGLSWQDGEYNTFIAALQRTLEHLGEKHTYSYLMGLSGAAFRLQIHWDGLCPSGPDATCGFNSGQHLLEVLRWNSYVLSSSDGEEKIQKAVRESIGRGAPVLAIDLIEVPDWGLIVGYEDDGQLLVLTYYNKENNKPQRAEKSPWIIYLLGEKLGPADKDQGEKNSLILVKNLLENSSYGPYHTGIRGFEIWLDRLKNMGRFLAGAGEKRFEHLLGNYWNYVSLIDCRRAAKHYLREEIRHRRFENDSLYGKLGSLFGEEAELLSQYHIMPPFKDQGKSMLEVENLGKQIETLEGAAELEKKVLEFWDKLQL